jgi:hypothetical protein
MTPTNDRTCPFSDRSDDGPARLTLCSISLVVAVIAIAASLYTTVTYLGDHAVSSAQAAIPVTPSMRAAGTPAPATVPGYFPSQFPPPTGEVAEPAPTF